MTLRVVATWRNIEAVALVASGFTFHDVSIV
jgi:hypothetical protein